MLTERCSYYFKEEVVIRTGLVRCWLETASGDWFLMKDLQLAQPLHVDELMFLKCLKSLKTICSLKSLQCSSYYLIYPSDLFSILLPHVLYTLSRSSTGVFRCWSQIDEGFLGLQVPMAQQFRHRVPGKYLFFFWVCMST